jgi:hypothetical protein
MGLFALYTQLQWLGILLLAFHSPTCYRLLLIALESAATPLSLPPIGL